MAGGGDENQAACGKAASWSRNSHSHASNVSAKCNSKFPNGGIMARQQMASRRSGTIITLTKGTAIKLAMGAINEVWEKKSSNNGVRPIAINKWILAHGHFGVGKR